MTLYDFREMAIPSDLVKTAFLSFWLTQTAPVQRAPCPNGGAVLQQNCYI
jgi:hypothetical protein